MLKRTMTYTDFDGKERTEDFYFNLTKAELTELEMSKDGGLVKMIEKIVAAQDTKEIISVFKDLVLTAYGEKSLDGRTFRKTDEIREAFKSTNAYSDLFMELAFNTESATAFVNGIVPTVS